MNYDVVVKQFKLNTVRPLLSKIYWNKQQQQKNPGVLLTASKKCNSDKHFDILWSSLIQTWYDDKY